MYAKYTEFRDYNIESTSGQKATIVDALFSVQGFKVKTIRALQGPVFRKNLLIPTEAVITQESTSVLRVNAPLSEYINQELPRQLPTEYPLSGPIPGALYAGWRKNRDSWLTKDVNRVIEHHRRYRPSQVDLFSCDKLLVYGFSAGNLHLGYVSDIVLETAEWMIPYFIVDRTENLGQSLCPNFLVHTIDTANKMFKTCIGPAAFESAPVFAGDLSSIDEDTLWKHYLHYYREESHGLAGVKFENGTDLSV